MVAALSLCMAGSFSAAPVFANDPSYVAVITPGNQGETNVNYENNDDVVVDRDCENGVYVGASTISDYSDTSATAVINGNVINNTSNPEVVKGVTTSSVVPESGTATTEVNVTGSVTVNPVDYNGIATGIYVSDETWNRGTPQEGSMTESKSKIVL